MKNEAKTAKQAIAAIQWMLDNIGWTKDTCERVNSKGKITGFCLLGAMGRVEASPEVYNRAFDLIDQAVVEVAGTTGKPNYIVGFNDSDRTRKRDINKVLKKAMEKADK